MLSRVFTGSVALVVCFCVGLPALFAQDKIVAIVNKDIITQKDLSDFINFTRMQLSGEYSPHQVDQKIAAMKNDLLEKLISDRLLIQEARKNSVTVDRARIKARIAELKERHGSRIEFQEALTRQGLTEADLENRMREQALMMAIVERKVRSQIKITPGDVTLYYQKNLSQFQVPETRDLESYTTKDFAKAQQIYAALAAGQKIGVLGDDLLSARSAMSASRGQLRKDIEEIVFQLPLEGLSAPLDVDGTYYVFKVKSILGVRQQTLSEVRDTIYNLLSSQKMQGDIDRWIDDLRSHAYIKIF